MDQGSMADLVDLMNNCCDYHYLTEHFSDVPPERDELSHEFDPLPLWLDALLIGIVIFKLYLNVIPINLKDLP